MIMQKYKVIVDDNFHFMDESESYGSGVFDTYEEAVAKCKEIIDEFLESAKKPDENAEQLYSTFVMYGETPHIHGEKLGDFSATVYAKQRCFEISTQQQAKTKKSAFLIKPLPGETVTQFKRRLKRLLKSETTQ
jgi:hypothetical protein